MYVEKHISLLVSKKTCYKADYGHNNNSTDSLSSDYYKSYKHMEWSSLPASNKLFLISRHYISSD